MPASDLDPSNNPEVMVVGTIPVPLPLKGTGVIICGTSRTVIPLPAGTRVILIKALRGNTGLIYLGGSLVTATIVSTAENTGLQLGPSEYTPYLPIADTTDLRVIGSAAGDGVTYMAF